MSSISKNFFYNIALALSQLIIPIFTFPYVSRVLGPSELGNVTFADSFVGYFMLIAALGIPIYGVREIASSKKENVKKVFSEIFSIHVVFTAILSVLYFAIIFIFFKDERRIDFLLWGSLMLMSTAFLCEWYFQGIGKFKFIAIRTIINRLFFFGLLFFLVHNEEDSEKYFLMIVLSTVFNAIVNFFIIAKNVEFKFICSLEIIRKHIKPLFYIFFSRASITLFLFLDTIILGLLAHNSQVGYFSTALKITKIPTMLIGSLGVVLIPNLAHAFANNNLILFRSLINKSVSFVLGVSLPIGVLFFSCSDVIIHLFAGNAYGGSSVIVKILCPIIILISLSTIFSQQVLIPMKKDREIMISVLIALVVCLVLDFLLIPIFAAKGAAITNLIVEFIIMLLTCYYALKYLPNCINGKLILQYVLLALPAFFFNYFIQMLTENLYLILFLNFIASGIYFCCTYGFLLKNEIFILLRNKLKTVFS